MVKQETHLENLAEIRSLMERSSRFLSLSGLSGVFAGGVALAGALAVYLYLDGEVEVPIYDSLAGMIRYERDIIVTLMAIAAGVLLLALMGAAYFTNRRAKRNNLPIWNATIRRFIIHLMIPLITGGIFCLALLLHGFTGLVVPSVLIFYGLSLISAGKFTHSDIHYLGLTEILLGIISIAFMKYGLLFWTLGFGVMHIVYGLVMYIKYKD